MEPREAGISFLFAVAEFLISFPSVTKLGPRLVCLIIFRHIISIFVIIVVIVPIFRRSIIIGGGSFADLSFIDFALATSTGITSTGSLAWVKVLFVATVTNQFSNKERDLLFVIFRDAIPPVARIDVNTIAIEAAVRISAVIVASLHGVNAAFRTFRPGGEVSSDGGGKGGNSVHEVIVMEVGCVFNHCIELLIVAVDSRD